MTNNIPKEIDYVNLFNKCILKHRNAESMNVRHPLIHNTIVYFKSKEILRKGCVIGPGNLTCFGQEYHIISNEDRFCICAYNLVLSTQIEEINKM